QQVVEAAIKHNRKICILGRSMVNVVGIAREKGYIKIPNDSIVEDSFVRNYRQNQICILCTGSQGESMAALSRIVNGEHRNIQIVPGDTVVFSSNPIPGNGVLVSVLINKLVKLGADVKQNSIAFSLHSSGHPSRQELRLLLRIVNPKYFMPAHGEYRMLKLHAELAKELGMNDDHVFVCDNGDVLQLSKHKVTRGGHVQAAHVYIDGNDLDGVSSQVINDREILKNDGMVAVILTIDSNKNQLIVPPIVYTRGFAASEGLHVVRHAKMAADDAISKLMVQRVNFAELKNGIKSEVSKYIYRKTQRSPMIIPIIMNAA
ncbi:MAG: ribonuclease J, partial [Bacillota bacterium]|nr:ribonuclease J [Bacillota bacterium]